MTLETMMAVGGAALIGLAGARAAMVAMVYAGHNMRTARRNKESIGNFRKAADALFEQSKQHARPTRSVEKASQSRHGKFRVIQKTAENPKGDICSFYLEPVDGGLLPTYKPGQFLTFKLHPPGAENPIVRCYSLSESPTQRQKNYRITVKKLIAPPNAPEGTPPGLSSGFLHDEIGEGDIIEALPPAGSFCLDRSSYRPVVLIAGGVGLTPLLSMLNWLAATESKREIWFFYGVRDRSEHAFHAHLDTVKQQMPNVHVVVFYASPSADCQLGRDYDVAGFINIDVMKYLLKARNYEFYVCGPPVMMETTINDLKAWGVPAADIMFESFGSGGAGTATQAADAPTVPKHKATAPKKDGTYQIEFARSKKSVVWSSRNGSLLDLAEASGIDAKCSCRAGQCGTCMVRLQAGDVDYDLPPETPPESGFCLPCIARPQSDLVLEL